MCHLSLGLIEKAKQNSNENIQYTFVAISSGMALKHRLLHCACPAKGEVLSLQTRAEKNKHVGLEKRETTWVLFRMRVLYKLWVIAKLRLKTRFNGKMIC